jgi:four helix bundle protein
MREPAKTFEDLFVWKKAHAFVLAVYRLSRDFPASEVYGLASQLQRAAVSIPANIAEGFRRRSKADKIRFLGISQGSLEECRYYLILVRDLGYGDITEAQQLIQDVSRLLEAYVSGIRDAAEYMVKED